MYNKESLTNIHKNFILKDYNNILAHYIYCQTLKVHIYILDVTQLSNEFSTYKIIMPDDRYNKMQRYRNMSDKLLLAGNEILFQYFMHKGNYPVDRCIGENGKPYILNNSNLFFNMSHSGKYAVCAFSSVPLGVDIEEILPIDIQLAKDYYCYHEYQDILKGPDNARIQHFYQYWVLKESFLKATGLGLSQPLNSFSLEEEPEAGIFYICHKVNQYKYLSQKISFFDDRFELAVCIQTS